METVMFGVACISFLAMPSLVSGSNDLYEYEIKVLKTPFGMHYKDTTVDRVQADSPAEEAGVRVGSVIIAINDTPVNDDNWLDCINNAQMPFTLTLRGCGPHLKWVGIKREKGCKDMNIYKCTNKPSCYKAKKGEPINELKCPNEFCPAVYIKTAKDLYIDVKNYAKEWEEIRNYNEDAVVIYRHIPSGRTSKYDPRRKLPDGWEAVTDANNRTYYGNHERNNLTQWDFPEAEVYVSGDFEDGDAVWRRRRLASSPMHRLLAEINRARLTSM